MGRSRPRVALVTGSSRGLGAAIARRLARDGLAVAVNGRRDDGRVVEVAASIQDAGGPAAAFPADMTDEREVSELVTAVGDVLGPVQVLVVNATGPQPEAPLSEVDWQDHLTQLSFFVRSPVLLGARCCQRCRRIGSVASSRSTQRSPTGRRRAGRRTPSRRTP